MMLAATVGYLIYVIEALIGVNFWMLMVFSAVHLFASYKSFSLTWELPNAILRWMGIQDHQDLGEQESKTNLVGMAAPAGGAIAGAAMSMQGGRGGNGGGDDERKKKPNGGGGEFPFFQSRNCQRIAQRLA